MQGKLFRMETATTHEARARNAKAQALAAVLHAHGATVVNALELPAAGWSMVAELASIEAGRKVHAPNSQATIDAVARILGLLIAADNDADAVAEAYPTFVAPTAQVAAVTETSVPELVRILADHPENPFEPGSDSAAAWDRQKAQRSPRDSAGYRTTMAAIAPQPETTEADLFAPFAQAAR
jgi:hypothetical protein